jgi:nucleotide-binding universal stress UspA family protein
MEVLIGEYEDHGRDVLQEVVEAAQERGIEIETQCNHGDPSEQIKHAIDRLDPDLTVMGLRGETHEKRTGTVTRKMTREFENVVIER